MKHYIKYKNAIFIFYFLYSQTYNIFSAISFHHEIASSIYYINAFNHGTLFWNLWVQSVVDFWFRYVMVWFVFYVRIPVDFLRCYHFANHFYCNDGSYFRTALPLHQKNRISMPTDKLSEYPAITRSFFESPTLYIDNNCII